MADGIRVKIRRRARGEWLALKIDLVEGSLGVIEGEIAKAALLDSVIRRLMTLPGVDMIVATRWLLQSARFVDFPIRKGLSGISV